jgi:hypothetical protein
MPTRGNPFAGALAGTLAAIEVRKLCADREAAAAGREVFYDARSHAQSIARLVRNPGCRFAHECFEPAPLADVSLREAFDLARASAAAWISVPDQRLVARLECHACGLSEEPWRVEASLDPACPRCGVRRIASGFDLADRMHRAAIPAALLARPLSERGLRPGDVLAVGDDTLERHYAIDDPAHGGYDAIVAGVGNVGSFAAPLVARIPEIGRLLLCDPDVYEPGQAFGQDVRPADVGRNKAEAQAERLRTLRPELGVEALAAPIESLPSGRLRGAIVMSCLDSLGARQRLAARAWRLGAPFVDAAVGGGESLFVRTNVYLPAAGAACFECAFEPADYDRVDRAFPCDAETARA